jgi:hypothetical protein
MLARRIPLVESGVGQQTSRALSRVTSSFDNAPDLVIIKAHRYMCTSLPGDPGKS